MLKRGEYPHARPNNTSSQPVSATTIGLNSETAQRMMINQPGVIRRPAEQPPQQIQWSSIAWAWV